MRRCTRRHLRLQGVPMSQILHTFELEAASFDVAIHKAREQASEWLSEAQYKYSMTMKGPSIPYGADLVLVEARVYISLGERHKDDLPTFRSELRTIEMR